MHAKNGKKKVFSTSGWRLNSWEPANIAKAGRSAVQCLLGHQDNCNFVHVSGMSWSLSDYSKSFKNIARKSERKTIQAA